MWIGLSGLVSGHGDPLRAKTRTMAKMKSAVMLAPRRVEIREVERPEADDGSVIIRTEGIGHWQWTDENNRSYEMSCKPLLRWFFSLDTFIMCEQIMEYRTTDGRVGYGLHENGYRLPWAGIDV